MAQMLLARRVTRARWLRLLSAPALFVAVLGTAGPAQAKTTAPLVSVSPNPIPLKASGAGPGAASKNGEIVTVAVGRNSTLRPNQRIVIMECQAHVLVSHARIDCDPTAGADVDAAGNEIETDAHGAFRVRFPINTLPTARSGFDPFSNVHVDAKNPLVLWIGFDFNTFNSQSLLSRPITISTGTSAHAAKRQGQRSSSGS